MVVLADNLSSFAVTVRITWMELIRFVPPFIRFVLRGRDESGLLEILRIRLKTNLPRHGISNGAEDMKADHIEYRISGSLQSSWQIFRQGMPIGIRRSILDAVGFATHLAERVATLSFASTKVTIDRRFGNPGLCISPELPLTSSIAATKHS